MGEKARCPDRIMSRSSFPKYQRTPYCDYHHRQSLLHQWTYRHPHPLACLVWTVACCIGVQKQHVTSGILRGERKRSFLQFEEEI